MNSKYRIYSIVHKPEQISEYIRYDNSLITTPDQKSYLFEYNPMVDILDNHLIEEEYLGIFSHKFHIKTGILRKKLYLFLNNFPNYDFYSFSKYSSINFHLPGFNEKSHPGFREIFEPICQDLNLPMSGQDLIYENFFITKTNIYKDYVNTIVKPAIQLLDTKYKDLAWRNAIYIPNQSIFENTGLPYYTFHTFILERLINQYIEKNKFTVKSFF